jgi:hypothetical protein
MKSAVGPSLENPCDSFKASAQTVSNKPATMSTTHDTVHLHDEWSTDRCASSLLAGYGARLVRCSSISVAPADASALA